jgi:hypothetical protein
VFDFRPGPDIGFTTSVGVRPHPRVVADGNVVFILRCPIQALGTFFRLPRSGAIRVREASARRSNLGIGRITPRSRQRCREGGRRRPAIRVVVELNARGRRLTSLRRDRRILVSIVGRRLPRAAWTVRLPSR